MNISPTNSIMNKFLFILGIAFILFQPQQVFSQGGNTCATAAASPIAIPFSGAGTICAATTTDDYDNVGASCADPLNTLGPDWVYYFCAPTTGLMNINLNNITHYCIDPVGFPYPYPSLTVWQGCPSTGTCVAGSTTSLGTIDPQIALEFTATAGQCYYILIDDNPSYCPCFDFNLSVSYVPIPATQPACTNMGFDAGSFAGWSGTYGYTVRDGATGAATPIYTPYLYTTASPMHTITAGAGLDPLGGFPVVAPGGGSNSMMLGDGVTAGYGGATLEQTFNVTAANALLTYQYAVVIQDANSGASVHTAIQQPFFKIEVFDCAGNLIVCGQYLVVGGPGIPGFFLAPGYTDVYYRPWTPVAVDLTPYIGTCAKIKFTVADCSLGAHFCYAYLDAKCAPMAITGPTNVCPGVAATLVAPSGAAAYSWTPGGQTTQTITVTPAASTTYTCTITSVAGPLCTTFLNYTVNVYPPASVSSTSQTVCAGTAATITATPTIPGGTFSWAPGGGTTASITVTPAATTTYVCTYTDLNGCSDTSHSTVTVTPLPTVVVNSPSICPGDTAHLVATGATTYTWSAGVTVTGVGTGDAMPAGTTTYTVTGTTAGCSNTATSTVTNGGTIVVNVNSPTICAGQTAALIASGGTTYVWSAGATSTGVNTASATPAATTTYTVTGSTGGCSGTATATVTVNPLPTVTVNSPSICAGQTANLSAGGATTYTWSAGATSTGVNTATATPAATTNYTVTGTTLGCSNTAIATVTINPAPVSTAGPDILLCTGVSGTIGAAGFAGNTYSWSPATGLSSITAANPTVTLTNAGASTTTTTYIVTTTNTASGCTSTDAVNVAVDPVQTANAGSPQSICFGSGFTLSGSVGGSATGGTWSGGSGTFSPNATTLNAVYTPSAADTVGGSVTLTLTSSGTGPCPFASSNVTLSFYPAPVVNFIVDDPDGCPVHCATFTDLSTVTGGGSIVSWNWNFGDGGSSTVQNPTHCYQNTGVYDVTLTVTTNNNCSATYTIIHMVNVFAIPVAAFNPNPNPASIFDGNITMNNQSSSDVTYWNWNFGDGDTLAPLTSSPTHLYPTTTPGTYNVTLIVHNVHGCYDTITHPVEVGPEFVFYIPNCVTPNGDGVNDYFQGRGIGIVTYDIWIFDRWGNMIFHGDYLDDRWDGRAN